MSNNHNLCISYLDESKIVDNGMQHYTIASMTARKVDYIQNIEVEWATLRNTYNIPDGQVLHFTDIKYLLNPNPKANRPYNPDLVAIFGDGSGNIDYCKLNNFFNDILSTISNLPFVVQITGFKSNPRHNIRQHGNRDFKSFIYFPPYIALREHLDLMAVYLLDLHHSANTRYNKRNKCITKLRYDGDVGLEERDDLKEAYHHSITLGTKHFKPEIIKTLFDEIRFIGKQEVAQTGPITHAGSEIIDFITTIAARNMWGLETNKIPIRVPNHAAPIDPLPVINSKIVNQQKINDIYF